MRNTARVLGTATTSTENSLPEPTPPTNPSTFIANWSALPDDVRRALSPAALSGISAGDLSPDAVNSDPLGTIGNHIGFDTAYARHSGYTEPQIATMLAYHAGTTAPDVSTTASPSTASPATADATTPPPDTSFLSALRYGLHNAAGGLGETLKQLGATGIGQTVQDSVDAPQGYQPATVGMSAAAQQGHYGDALSYAPRYLLESLPDMAGATGAGLAGGALGGPVGAVAGAGAYGESRYLGSNLADTRAANNGATPTAGQAILDAGLAAGGGMMDGLVAPGAALRAAKAARFLATDSDVASVVGGVAKGGLLYEAAKSLIPDDGDVTGTAARRSRVQRFLQWMADRVP